MKKSTGILFVVAAALAAFVYFYEMKRNPRVKNGADAPRPAFALGTGDINGIKIAREGKVLAFDLRTDGWYLSQPLATRADQPRVLNITDQLASLQAQTVLASGSDKLASFGLEPPAATIEFTTKNGAKHALRMGAEDFSDTFVYAQVDDARGVVLVPDAMLTATVWTADDFRDHSVLDLPVAHATSFDLTSESGEVSAVLKDGAWTIEKPRAVAADSEAIASMLAMVAIARITQFVADPSKDLETYGLAKPAIELRITTTDSPSGVQRSALQIGKKDGDEYYARDTARPGIFRVNGTLYEAIHKQFGDLRDKSMFHFAEGDIAAAEVQSANGTKACVRGPTGELVEKGAADQEGSADRCPNFLQALSAASVLAIYDTPSAELSAKLAKPIARITVTNSSGKKVEIQVSAPSQNTVYARTSDGPEVYKIDDQFLGDLNIKGPQ